MIFSADNNGLSHVLWASLINTVSNPKVNDLRQVVSMQYSVCNPAITSLEMLFFQYVHQCRLMKTVRGIFVDDDIVTGDV
jgi:hypothetical protein